MAAKRLMIGFKSVMLLKVLTDDASGYTTDTAVNAISLPYAGSMTLNPKETTQDFYYDDDQYDSIRDLKGYDVELHLAEADFTALKALGAGTYDTATGILDENMIPAGDRYSLRFVANTTSGLPIAVKYRSFKITSVRETGYTTRGDNITANEIIVYGTVNNPTYTGAKYRAKIMLAEGDPAPNQAAFDTFMNDAETLPGA